ncbi:MAG: hypothetical protein ACTSU2_04115 [Promethearchaeota archaeon]
MEFSLNEGKMANEIDFELLKKFQKLPSSLEFKESRQIPLINAPSFEVSKDSHVFMVPFRSNIFYYTHNFWLSEKCLIVQSYKELSTNDLQKMYWALDNYLLSIDFMDSDEKIKITKIIPSDIKVESAVLSWDKKFLIILSGNEIIKYKAGSWDVLDRIKIREEFLQKNPKLYRIGQLSLSADNRILYMDVNINLDLDNIEQFWEQIKKRSTFILAIDLDTQTQFTLEELPFPWYWGHILPSPKNPNIFTSALTKYKDNLRTLVETKQRLWLWDISTLRKDLSMKAGNRISDRQGQYNSSKIKKKPLYHQNRRFPFKREIVTHECWCKNGKYLTFVVRRSKIKRIFVESGVSQILVKGRGKIGPYPWHCDGNNPDLIVFDTMNPASGIWIKDIRNDIDKKSGTLIAKENTTMDGQMFHPHPILSPNKDFVLFNANIGNEGYIFKVNLNYK